MKINIDETLGLLLLLGAGIFLLSQIAANPRFNPRFRFIAQKLEGDLYQDLLTGQFIVFA